MHIDNQYNYFSESSRHYRKWLTFEIIYTTISKKSRSAKEKYTFQFLKKVKKNLAEEHKSSVKLVRLIT